MKNCFAQLCYINIENKSVHAIYIYIYIYICYIYVHLLVEIKMCYRKVHDVLTVSESLEMLLCPSQDSNSAQIPTTFEFQPRCAKSLSLSCGMKVQFMAQIGVSTSLRSFRL